MSVMMSMSSGLKVLVAAALVASPTVSVAQACQGSRCVLPLQPNAPAPLPEVVDVPDAVPVETVAVPAERGGIGLPLLLLGALALAGLAYLLLSDDNDDGDRVSP